MFREIMQKAESSKRYQLILGRIATPFIYSPRASRTDALSTRWNATSMQKLTARASLTRSGVEILDQIPQNSELTLSYAPETFFHERLFSRCR